TSRKSMFDRWTGASTKGPSVGTLSRPTISSRNQIFVRATTSARTTPYATRSSRVGGWTSTGAARTVSAGRRASGCGGSAGSAIGPPRQELHDLVDVEVTGVHLDGVPGPAQRRRL